MNYEVGVICGTSRVDRGFPDSWGRAITTVNNIDNNLTPCQGYQLVLDGSNEKYLIMIHDDVEFHDAYWQKSLADVMETDPDAVAVGVGGATSLGRKDLYRKPYNIWNMARGGYASNQKDAETHGERFTGVRKVAVLDAFCMAVRVDWLRSRGGWPVNRLTHHCLDLWLACEAARCGKSIYMVGVACHHHGGGTSTKESYAKASWLQGGTMEKDHEMPHKWLYEEYRDVLPIEVKL